MDCLKEGRLYMRDSLSVKFAFLKRTAKIHFCNSGKFYQIYINKSDIMKVASTFNKNRYTISTEATARSQIN